MRNICKKGKKLNIQNKTKTNSLDTRLVVTRGEGEVRGWAKCVKGVNYIVIYGY